MKKSTPIIIAAIVALLCSPAALAQDEGSFDEKKAIKQIKDDLDKVLQDLSSLNSDKVDPKTGEHAVKKMDELLDKMKNSQGRIVDNIDELIKNMKMNPSGSPSDQPKDDQQKSQQKGNKGGKSKRDRNKKPEKNKRDQPENKDGKKPKGKKKPGGEDQQKKNKNGKSPQKAPESGVEKVPVIQDSESWGHLPSEVRQLLIEKNYRDYFPNYGDEISDYLKSLKK